MIAAGPDEKIYPVVKIAMIVNALAAEGISCTDALCGVDLSKSEMHSPATRISLNQVIQCYRNAARLTRSPPFAYRTGLKFHVSTYGMYGFAILSSTNARRCISPRSITSSQPPLPKSLLRKKAITRRGRSFPYRIPGSTRAPHDFTGLSKGLLEVRSLIPPAESS